MTKEVDFLFEYEVKNRELDHICLIAAYLELQGYTVGFINTWDSLFHKPQAYKAKVMVISACYRDGVYDYFGSHAINFEKVVNLQWEQLYLKYEYAANRLPRRYSGVALHTHHICWGKKQKEYMHDKCNISNQYIDVCGYIPLDFYGLKLRAYSMSKEELFSKYGLDERKKTLLFISSFAMINLPVTEGTSGDDIVKKYRKNLQIESQDIIVKWFYELAMENPDIQIVYRPHHAEAGNVELKKIEKSVPNFFIIGAESIRNWIMNCDILYNWQSTAMVELYVSKKKTYILRPIQIEECYDYPYYIKGEYYEINSYEQLQKSILEKETEFPLKAEHLLEYYDIQNRSAYERTADKLIELLNDKYYLSRPAKYTIFQNGKINKLSYRRIKTSIRNARYFKRFYKIIKPYVKSTKLGRTIERYEREDKEREISRAYRIEKMELNRTTEKEIRERIDTLKKLIL